MIWTQSGVIILIFPQSAQFDPSDLEDAETEGVDVADCDPGYYIDNTDPDNPSKLELL